MQTPSACTVVKCSSSPKISDVDIAWIRQPLPTYEVLGKHTWVRSAIDDDLIQDVVRAIWLMSMMVIHLLTNELFDKVFVGTIVTITLLRAHHCRFEPQPETDSDAVGERLVDRLLVLAEIEFCEKAERAEGEGQNRWYHALEEP